MKSWLRLPIHKLWRTLLLRSFASDIARYLEHLVTDAEALKKALPRGLSVFADPMIHTWMDTPLDNSDGPLELRLEIR